MTLYDKLRFWHDRATIVALDAGSRCAMKLFHKAYNTTIVIDGNKSQLPSLVRHYSFCGSQSALRAMVRIEKRWGWARYGLDLVDEEVQNDCGN